MNDQERATLLAAISELTTMLDGVLQVLNGILDGCDEVRNLNAAQVAELRDHAQVWTSQVARLKISTASAAIKPPERLH